MKEIKYNIPKCKEHGILMKMKSVMIHTKDNENYGFSIHYCPKCDK